MIAAKTEAMIVKRMTEGEVREYLESNLFPPKQLTHSSLAHLRAIDLPNSVVWLLLEYLSIHASIPKFLCLSRHWYSKLTQLFEERALSSIDKQIQ